MREPTRALRQEQTLQAPGDVRLARLTPVDQIDIKSAQVGLIGVGNMGQALLVALLKAGADPSKINFAVRRAERNLEIEERYGISAAPVEEMAAISDVLMIIVKPQDLEPSHTS